MIKIICLLFTVLGCITASAHTQNNDLDRFLPSLGELSPDEGYNIIWRKGHPQYFSELARNLFKIPASNNLNEYLVGCEIIFSTKGINQKHFQQQQSIIRDIFAKRILRQFKGTNYQLNFSNDGFHAIVGQNTTRIISNSIKSQTANWIVKDIHGIILKRPVTTISYTISGHYAQANISVNGNLKLNLGQNIHRGEIIFVRQGPGLKPLTRQSSIKHKGRFRVTSLAPGHYKIYYSNHKQRTLLRHHFELKDNQQDLTLLMRYKVNYDISIKLTQKKDHDVDLVSEYEWNNFTIALPQGLSKDDINNELSTIPHFLGDFNSPIRLDTAGNPLEIPYADDNLDQLVFLSWQKAATNTSISGHFFGHSCELIRPDSTTLYFSATLHPTTYGPWILQSQKIYANFKLNFQCGLSYSPQFNAIALPDIPIGEINDLGELQAEIADKILTKITHGRNFSLKWKFLSSDNYETTIKLKAKAHAF